MRGRRIPHLEKLRAVLTVLWLACLAIAGSLHAQSGRSALEVRSGGVFPAGDLADLADPGYSLAIGFVYGVGDRLALRLDGSGNWFSGQRFATAAPQAPQPFDLLLWHYTVGLEYELTRPSSRGLVVKLSGGLGATTFNTDGFGPTANPVSGRLETDFNRTYLSTVGGLRVGRRFGPGLTAFVEGQAFVTFVDQDASSIFPVLSGGQVDALGTVVSFPLRVGLRLRL